MIKRLSRRDILAAAGATTAMGWSAHADKPRNMKIAPKIVVIGGGFAGASAARQLAGKFSNVTLIEPNPVYTSCPFSNLVIAGYRPMEAQRYTYDRLRDVRVIHDWVDRIQTDHKTVKIRNGQYIPYDKLILSPGIDFRWSDIEGFNPTTAEIMPHAWKAGPQTELLKRQLQNMPDGGTVIISIPPPPFRCPPGPYERASLIAHYLKTHKPRSKILVLDAQDNFSKQALFEAGWKKHYGDMIERIPGSESGQVVRIAPETMTVFTDFDAFKGDVINIIPPQKAGQIALDSGAANGSGWCPINATTFESALIPDVHIIGDATIAAPMPKSAFSANLQGKICALQIALMLNDQPPMDTVLSNTCYSYLAPNEAFSVSGVYHNKNGEFSSVSGSGGTSPLGEYPALREAEAIQAIDWFNTITKEAFG